MAIKDFWKKTYNLINVKGRPSFEPEITNDGLIASADENQDPTPKPEHNHVIVKKTPQNSREQSIELIQQGMTDLLSQLKGINDNLAKQVHQQETLTDRIENLPEMVKTIPAVVHNQSKTVDAMLEQLKSEESRSEKFIEAVEKIPAETGKQTDALTDIKHQLSASSETDVQMAESFNNFKNSVDTLNNMSKMQTDSLQAMNKTFAASDRYMKYLVSKQSKRFAWLFIATISISTISIITLIIIIAILAAK